MPDDYDDSDDLTEEQMDALMDVTEPEEGLDEEICGYDYLDEYDEEEREAA